MSLRLADYRSCSYRFLVALALLVGLSASVAEAGSSLRVAVCGAIERDSGVYALPSNATVRDLLVAAGGATSNASGRFVLLTGRTLYEDSNVDVPLQDGDVVVALERNRPRKQTRTVVLVSAAGSPIVVEVPESEASVGAITAKLPEHLARTTRVLWPRATTPVQNGTLLHVGAVDYEFWGKLSAALPVIRHNAVTVANQPAVVPHPQSQLLAAGSVLPGPASAIPAPPREQQFRATAAEPEPVAVPIGQGPTPAAPMPEFDVIPRGANPVAAPAPLPLVATVPVSRQPSIDVTARNEAATPHPLMSSQDAAELETTTLEQLPPELPLARETTAIEVAETIEESPVRQMVNSEPAIRSSAGGTQYALASRPQPASPNTLTAAAEINGLISASAEPSSVESASTESGTPAKSSGRGTIAFVIGSLLFSIAVSVAYLFVQHRQPIVNVADADESKSAAASVPINSMAVVQEESQISAPLAMTGRVVALGHLRIDAAHEEPTGPHFGGRQQSGSNRGRRSGNHRQTVTPHAAADYENDLLGRALTMMSRERDV